MFLPGKSHGRRSLAGYSPRGSQKSRIRLSNWAHTHTDRHNLFKQTRLWVTPILWPVSKPHTREEEDVGSLSMVWKTSVPRMAKRANKWSLEQLCKHSMPLILSDSWFLSLLFYVLSHDPCLLADHTASEGERKIFRKRGRGSAPGKPEGFQSFLGPQGEKTSKKNKGAGPFHILPSQKLWLPSPSVCLKNQVLII